MAITTQTLYDQKKLQFGAGASTSRFVNDFIQAIQRTLGELESKANLSATAPTNIQTNIELDDALYGWVVSAGVDYHLVMLGYSAGANANPSGVWIDAVRTAQMKNHIDEETTGKLGDLTED